LKNLFRLAKQSVLSYVLANLITGIEGGVGIVLLNVVWEYSFETSIAIMIPILYPVLIVQMIIIYLVLNKLGKQPKENTII